MAKDFHKSQCPLKIAVACGGTGGHTYPGLATANTLALRGHKVEVLVSGRDIESSTLKGWDGVVFKTHARKGHNPFHIAHSTLRTLCHFIKNRPNAVLAMGSYASLPPVLAAWFLRIPVVLHEANAVPGKSNAFLSRFAKAVATSFPGGEGEYHCKKVVRTGLPVRRELLNQPKLDEFDNKDGFTVFITGGSQGAVAVNEIASKTISLIAKSNAIKGLKVIHQTGKAPETKSNAEACYREANVNAFVAEFMDMPKMGAAFKAADLVIARSGAATCAEISLFGLPSILIPLPTAVRQHQYLNAKYLADAGAAIVMNQSECTPEILAETIISLAQDKEKLSAFGNASLSLTAKDAADSLSDLIESITR